MNVLLLTDDQRWDTIAALGNSEIKTPHLDALVKRGHVFTNAYCQGSMVGAVCLPSRTMIETGLSLFRIPDGRAATAPAGTPILPKVLRDSGCVTYRTGKAGNTCAFANAAYDTNVNDNTRAADASEAFADRIIDFLGRQKPGRRPFFACAAFSHPHDPRNAPKEYMAMYDPAKLTLSKNFMPRHPFDNGELAIRDEKLAPLPRMPDDMRRHLADYYACITCLDAQVGRILAAMKDNGHAESTLVIFTSDQGLAVGGRHGLMGKQNLTST